MKNNYLALGGLFASLHVLFLFLSKVIVGSELLLVLFLALTPASISTAVLAEPIYVELPELDE